MPHSKDILIMYKHCFKRLLDIALSFTGLFLLSPLFLILSIWVKLDSEGPVLFKQKRIGIHKKEFNILKYRTMRINTPKDVPTHLLQGSDQYITKAGRILRKTSLDEIPQLINILRGDMSIVGPRPALYNQYDLIEERDKYGANDVMPGLTGLAQVNGRDELDIEKKAALDGEYTRNLCFSLDLKCFLQTFSAVFTQKGIREGSESDASDGEL